ncbi:NAD(+) kinase [Aliiglaciecola sp. CAU 1673]|uniref:NAD(+) kinase n=1 Tax=Aliiglaciecola sp. CAU 1673 TaxID=3032595 RepID=UPI0023DBEDEA|nr:NAD(+) kinase [Aliiglaciecola sp. CAU 1673]MDF2178106.1 NAD(+) kinase [Aliiglaciecola sp. CAU 1673]
MQSSFNTIGLIGKPKHEGANESLCAILAYLKDKGCRILLEQRVAADLEVEGAEVMELVDIGRHADLAIVVGGDGNMLGAARVLSRFNVGVVGVNRGNLGFLTDIHPEEIETQLQGILDGDYVTEQRFLLEVSVFRHDQVKSTNAAINEAVLHHGNVAHMMEFEVYIDDQFMFSQRSDGLIVATPTGSTAYSLSGGGPILTPNLNALSMVPMFPHTLSSRPIVVDADSSICLKISLDNVEPLQVSCDGHNVLAAQPGDEIRIRKNPYTLRLIHPRSYNYFEVLRTKLGWGSKLY